MGAPDRGLDINAGYEEKYGFSMPDTSVFRTRKGLDEEVVRQISALKNEPAWMTEKRVEAYRLFAARPLPSWGDNAALREIDFDDITYYVRPGEAESDDWKEVPPDIKNTFDRLGVPDAERRFLAGVTAQYESEVVYHSIHAELEKKGVIFLSMDEGLKRHPEIVQKYFGSVIPSNDNKFAALNTAVWSGGSFIYVPKGVKVDATGCPLPEPKPEMIPEKGQTLVLEGVYFDTDKATLKPESVETLDRVAASLKAFPAVRLEVAGHTDSRGAKAHNQKLSEARAKTVMDYLVGKGVDAGRLAAKGYGMDKPIAPNTTDEGRAKNRRVELSRLD